MRQEERKADRRTMGLGFEEGQPEQSVRGFVLAGSVALTKHASTTMRERGGTFALPRDLIIAIALCHVSLPLSHCYTTLLRHHLFCLRCAGERL